MIPGDEVTGCVEFDIIDNKVALEGDRTYPLRITVIEPAGSGITIPDSTLTITENDSKFSVFLFLIYYLNISYSVRSVLREGKLPCIRICRPGGDMSSAQL